MEGEDFLFVVDQMDMDGTVCLEGLYECIKGVRDRSQGHLGYWMWWGWHTRRSLCVVSQKIRSSAMLCHKWGRARW